jgi:DNA-binding MarR family transcriptional regulator
MYSVWLSVEEQRVWRSLLTMVSRLSAAMNRQLQRDCGLSLSDYDVLVALSERGPLRMYQLADRLAWEQSRLSHQLRRMRDRGLVVRHGSDDDRRGATVVLTEAGRTALEFAAPGHAELVRSLVFDGMSATQLRTFGAVIETVLGRLDQDASR